MAMFSRNVLQHARSAVRAKAATEKASRTGAIKDHHAAAVAHIKAAATAIKAGSVMHAEQHLRASKEHTDKSRELMSKGSSGGGSVSDQPRDDHGRFDSK